MTSPDRVSDYCRAVLAREVDALRSVVKGGRNLAAFRAAAQIGQLVQPGGLDYGEAEAALLDAVSAWEPAEAAKGRATIRRGLAEGMKTPRDLGALSDRGSFSRPAPRPTPSPSAAAPVSAPPPSRPPLAEVEALWNAGLPVTAAGAEPVADLLRRRGLDAADVEDRNLVRRLPLTGALPSWAAIGSRSWRESGHLALLPAFDTHGELVTLRARSVLLDVDVKEVSAQGHSTRGTVYADALGRMLLREGCAPGWIPADRLRVVVAEGGPDFLIWATRCSDADEIAPAVFGIFAGGWTQEIADRIPAGCTIAIWTDADDAGDHYADKIAQTFGHHVRLLRPRKELHHAAS